MPNPIDLLRRQGLAFNDFMNGTSIVKAAADHAVPLVDLEGMIRNHGNENITELATEIASQLGSDERSDIDFIYRWILFRFAHDLPMDAPVATFSREHDLPSRNNLKS